MNWTIERIIDLDRYPLQQSTSHAYSDLVDDCRYRVDTLGGATLEGFLRPSARETIIQELDEHRTSLHRSVGRASATLKPPTADQPANHPDRIVGTSSLGVIAYDRLAQIQPLRVLYEWNPLRTFLGHVYGTAAVHPYADDMRPVNVFVMQKDDQNWWHLDGIEFTTILQLQNPVCGGDFEYRRLPEPDSIGWEKALYEIVSGDAKAEVMPREVGSLHLFKGKNVVHRVTRIEGNVDRITAILGFSHDPQKASSQSFQLGRYGRVGRIYAD